MYIYGKNVCREKILSSFDIRVAYLVSTFNDKGIIDLIKGKGIKYKFVPKDRLDKMVLGQHQGIVLDVCDYKCYDIGYIDLIKSEYPLVVMLDHLEDPHNFGAIVRSCEALGVDAIIIPSDRSVDVNDTVIKTSVGAISYIKIIKVSNLSRALDVLKSKGYWVVGSDMSSISISDISVDMPICLVIGNEGKGMSRLVRESCDHVVSIPMEGRINSLNASVACSILVYKIKDMRR